MIKIRVYKLKFTLRPITEKSQTTRDKKEDLKNAQKRKLEHLQRLTDSQLTRQNVCNQSQRQWAVSSVGLELYIQQSDLSGMRMR